MFSYGRLPSSDAFYGVQLQFASGAPIAVGRSGGGDGPQWGGAVVSNWYHVAITFDGVTATLFINGEAKQSLNRTYTTSRSGFVNVGDFVEPGSEFHGALDDFRFYNRVLSAVEVQELYQIERDPPGPQRATATAQVVNGFVVGINLSNFGSGYTEPPAIRLFDSTGTGAEARAVVTNGRIAEIVIVSPGRNYSANTVVAIASPLFPPELAVQVSKVRVTVRGNLGSTFLLEGSSDLQSWTKVSEFVAEDELIALDLDVHQHGRFFRVLRVK